jgi:hypothetical protein
MENASRNGMGCGVILMAAGVVELCSLMFGWGESHRAIFQLLKLLGMVVGSPYLGAGLYIIIGAGLIALGWGIQEFNRERQPAKSGAAGSARYLGLATEQPLQGYVLSAPESYLNFVENTMIRNGFEPIQFSTDTRAYYKMDFRQSSEFYFILGRVKGTLTPEKVQAISQRTFNFVEKNKRANTLFCYPVIMTENIPVDVQKFIRSYNPKHLAQFEFPVIVDLSSRKLFYYPGTPLWGAAMYGTLRKNADLLLSIPKM